MSSPLAGLAFINAIAFGIYGNVLKCFSDKTAILSHVVAGMCAGLCQSLIVSPMELLKLRVQVQRPNADSTQFRGPGDCLKRTFRANGVKGLFRGLSVTVLRDCPALGTYFASYEIMTKRLSKDGRPESLTATQLLVAGGLAGMSSWLVNYPTDVVKSRFQADGTDPSRCRYSSVRDCVYKTYAEGGWRPFSAGLGSTMLRAFPTNAATFFAVEWTFRIYETHIEPRWVKEKPKKLEKRPSKHDQYADDETWNKLLPEAGSTLIDPGFEA